MEKIKEHYECGRLGARASYAMDKADAVKGAALKKMKRTEPKKYALMLKKLAESPNAKKGAQFTPAMLDIVSDGVTKSKISRTTAMEGVEGYIYMDREEYQFHWKTRKGWGKKHAGRQFDMKINDAKSSTMVHKTRGKLLGVEKMPEANKIESLVLSKELEAQDRQLTNQEIESVATEFEGAKQGKQSLSSLVKKPVQAILKARGKSAASDGGPESGDSDEEEEEEEDEDADDKNAEDTDDAQSVGTDDNELSEDDDIQAAKKQSRKSHKWDKLARRRMICSRW